MTSRPQTPGDRTSTPPTPSTHFQLPPAGTPDVLVPFGSRTATRIPIGRRTLIPRLPDGTAPTTSLDPRPVPRPGRRRALGAAAVAATLLIAAIGWQVYRSSSGPDPRELVQRLFDGLTAHDVTAWTAYDVCTHDNPICQPDALRAGYQPPEHVTIDGQTETSDAKTGRQAYVTVSYDVAGTRVTDHVTLQYQSAGIIGGSWSITTRPAIALTVPGPQPAPVTVAAADIPTARLADGPLTITAPPGQYTISRTATPLVAPTATTAAGTPGSTTAVTLPATVPTPISDTITQLIHDRIDACAAQHDFQPEAGTTRPRVHTCPFTHNPTYAITDDPTWTIQQYPQLQLTAGTDGTITITTAVAGRVAIHYRYTMHVIEPRDWTDVDATEPITVTGHITTGPGGLEWAPD
ncbi:hypothetical protein [Dactylosporangium sp. NPDC049140]|uniref:hypothetical protein n=1 Tax=Dactylosporangium sp. NPDC049140 TaxID=3155647 RepID=UPI0033D7CCCB